MVHISIANLATKTTPCKCVKGRLANFTEFSVSFVVYM